MLTYSRTVETMESEKTADPRMEVFGRNRAGVLRQGFTRVGPRGIKDQTHDEGAILD